MKQTAKGRRILIATHIDWRTYYQPYLLARHLARRGADVLLLSTTGNLEIGPGYERDGPRPGPGHGTVLLHALRVAREALFRRWDAVIAFDLASIDPVLPLTLRYRPRTFKAIWFLEFEEDGYQKNFRTRRGLLFLKQYARRIDYFMEANPWRGHQSGDWRQGTITMLIPNGPSASDWPKPQPRAPLEGPPTILYTGTNADYARIDKFIEALALCRIPARATLALTGPRDRTAALGALSEKLGLTDRVKFIAPMPSARIKDFLATEGQIGLCFSGFKKGDPINRVWPAPNKFGEYLASGLACLMSPNVAELTYRRDEIGESCDPNDPAGIAAAIDRLCTDARHVECGVKAREVFEQGFDFDKKGDWVLSKMRQHWRGESR